VAEKADTYLVGVVLRWPSRQRSPTTRRSSSGFSSRTHRSRTKTRKRWSSFRRICRPPSAGWHRSATRTASTSNARFRIRLAITLNSSTGLAGRSSRASAARSRITYRRSCSGCASIPRTMPGSSSKSRRVGSTPSSAVSRPCATRPRPSVEGSSRARQQRHDYSAPADILTSRRIRSWLDCQLLQVSEHRIWAEIDQKSRLDGRICRSWPW